MKYQTWEVRAARVWRITIEMIDDDGKKFVHHITDFEGVRAIAICDEVHELVPHVELTKGRAVNKPAQLPERKIVS